MGMDDVIRRHPMLQDVRCGVSVRDGWDLLVTSLCSAIENHCKVSDAPLPVVTQVKEKFGGLRFYVDSSDAYVDGLIDMAERMSTLICEVCGDPGELRDDGWIRTLCEKHHKEQTRR